MSVIIMEKGVDATKSTESAARVTSYLSEHNYCVNEPHTMEYAIRFPRTMREDIMDVMEFMRTVCDTDAGVAYVKEHAAVMNFLKITAVTWSESNTTTVKLVGYLDPWDRNWDKSCPNRIREFIKDVAGQMNEKYSLPNYLRK